MVFSGALALECSTQRYQVAKRQPPSARGSIEVLTHTAQHASAKASLIHNIVGGESGLQHSGEVPPLVAAGVVPKDYAAAGT